MVGRWLPSVRGICPMLRARRGLVAMTGAEASTEEREKAFEELLMRESAEMRSRRDDGEMEEAVVHQHQPDAVMLDDLVREGGGGGESTDSLVKQLDDYGFGVVTVSGWATPRLVLQLVTMLLQQVAAVSWACVHVGYSLTLSICQPSQGEA